MAENSLPTLTLVKYPRIYADSQGESYFGLVTVEQGLAQAAPPAAPFYVSDNRPASK